MNSQSADLANAVFERLLDCAEAAALLRLHPKTVERMARTRLLPAVHVGKFWRFRASELDTWIRSKVSFDHHPCRE